MKLMLVDGARLGVRLKTSLPTPKRRPVEKCVVLLDEDPRWKVLHWCFCCRHFFLGRDNLPIKTPGSTIGVAYSHGAKAMVESSGSQSVGSWRRRNSFGVVGGLVAVEMRCC